MPMLAELCRIKVK